MAADPDTLVLLMTARTEFEASTIAASLEDQGIPAKVFATAAATLQWEGGYNDPIKIMVRRADRERAAVAVRQTRQDSVDIDWSEVDVGSVIDPPEAFPLCPACGFDRAGISAGLPCPECGYAGIAADRRSPGRRATWRPLVRRVGFVLMLLAFGVGIAGPVNAVPVLIVAFVLILWGNGGKSAAKGQPTRPPAPPRR